MFVCLFSFKISTTPTSTFSLTKLAPSEQGIAKSLDLLTTNYALH
jgi:hypothetical protein